MRAMSYRSSGSYQTREQPFSLSSLRSRRNETYDSIGRWLSEQERQSTSGLMVDARAAPSRLGSFTQTLINLDENEEDQKSNAVASSRRFQSRAWSPIASSTNLRQARIPPPELPPPKRKVSHMGHSDDEVIIIEPPPGVWRNRLLERTRDAARRVDRLEESPAKKLKTTTMPHPPINQRQEPECLIITDPLLELETPLAKKTKKPVGNKKPKTQKRRRDFQQQSSVVDSQKVSRDGQVVSCDVQGIPYFLKIAPEIRDEIYRCLLVSRNYIPVSRLWTQVVRRSRIRNGDVDITIDPKILRVCRQTAEEGTRILYSENNFMYLLRDPEAIPAELSRLSDGGNSDNDEILLWIRTTLGTGTRSNVGDRGSARRQNMRYRIKAATRAHGPLINLDKFGHLIRHMGVELEPNRTGKQYQSLLVRALEALVNTPELVTPPPSLTSMSPVDPWAPINKNKISLNTLTVTISPVFEQNQRALRGSDDEEVVARDGQYLSIVKLFSRGSPMIKALKRIDTNFVRINLYSPFVTGDNYIKRCYGPVSYTDGKEPPRHLETTLDLRFLSRHMEVLQREGVFGQMWENDKLILDKREELGRRADSALRGLRQRIEEGCLEKEKCVRRGLWEDHIVAERRRIEDRRRHEENFDHDSRVRCKKRMRMKKLGYDSADSSEFHTDLDSGETECEADGDQNDDDDSGDDFAAPRKTLKITIDRVDGHWRAYRAWP
ncbi:hypothetical protein B0T26DRAFT_123891 [Lasiosphaeria miniovina]|uniref:Uncharacterized protein n=1 Tax=Lasiosphaeria miniovina TaxID=1954250 RepID=A0AA40E6W1_9PEZI|nr:uncharacterized protein B0T26DRAFT_123891 [Lasiosphaeria miniovina]KAK0727222.1 hypothetical protein B0T26DRAFT_123891 [Lasiosphaeria miniovina]